MFTETFLTGPEPLPSVPDQHTSRVTRGIEKLTDDRNRDNVCLDTGSSSLISDKDVRLPKLTSVYTDGFNSSNLAHRVLICKLPFLLEDRAIIPNTAERPSILNRVS